MYGVAGRFKHHVRLDFGYEGTNANYCICLLWCICKKMVILKVQIL